MSLFRSDRKTILEPGTQKILLKDVEIRIQEGEILWLKGSNGLGKTQLMLSLLRDFDLKGLRYAYFPQTLSSQLLFSCSVADILALKHDHTQILLDGIDTTKHWNMLSGGERQRVGLAVILASSSQIYVLDEPTNHMDAKHTIELWNILDSMCQSRKKSFLLTSHEQPHASSLRCVDLEAFRT